MGRLTETTEGVPISEFGPIGELDNGSITSTLHKGQAVEDSSDTG